MPSTLAFDIYGTLINTHGVVSKLETMVSDKAMDFSQSWRDKQLEYSFRKGLMRNYENFAVCTRQALDYTCQSYKQDLSDAQKQELMESYKTLPAFDDVKDSLLRLQAAGFRLYAFSNGSGEAVETLLQTAGIRELFIKVISVDDLKTFKPDPAVYCHMLREAGAEGESAWLISSNPFDVLGALSAGLKAAWIQRSPEALFDPWGVEPTVTVSGLDTLVDALSTVE